MAELSPVVAAIGELHLEGNVIPHTWYHHPLLQHENGKPNLVAIILLSDLLYWYKPSYIRDPDSGRVLGAKQKFWSDMLQKYYEPWGQTFGFTEKQVRDAIRFLRERNIVRTEQRVVDLKGRRLGNVPYIEPVVETIYDLCATPATPSVPESIEGMTSMYRGSGDESIEGPTSTYRGGGDQSLFNSTENTTEKGAQSANAQAHSAQPSDAQVQEESERKRLEKEAQKKAREADRRKKLDKEFELTFWPQYPKKRDKERARVAFYAARSKASLEDIMEGLTAWKLSALWLKDNGDFIKYPQGWLNGESWIDPPAPLSTAGNQGNQTSARSVIQKSVNTTVEIERQRIARLMAQPPE